MNQECNSSERTGWPLRRSYLKESKNKTLRQKHRETHTVFQKEEATKMQGVYTQRIKRAMLRKPRYKVEL